MHTPGLPIPALACVGLFFLFAAPSAAQPGASTDSLLSVWHDASQTDSVRATAYFNHLREHYLWADDPDSAFTLAATLLTYAAEHRYLPARTLGYRLQGLSLAERGQHRQALEYSQKALESAEASGVKDDIGKVLLDRGNSYYYLSEFPKAVAEYQRSLRIMEELGNEPAIGGTLMNIGTIYYNQGSYTRALENYQLSLASAERRKEKIPIADALLNVGNVYNEQDDYGKAIERFQRGLGLYREAGHRVGEGMALNNLASVYRVMGEYHKGLDYSRQAMAVYQELGEDRLVARSLWHIGNNYRGLGQLDSALANHQRSLAMTREIGDRNGEMMALNTIGTDRLEGKQYALALPVCRQALELATGIGVLTGVRDACACLYQANKALGQDKEALQYHEQFLAMQDSLYNRETTEKLTQLGMQYDFDQQEAEARAEQERKDALAEQELRRQKVVRNGFMGGFAVVLLFAGIFLSQRNRIGKEKARSEELLLNILPGEVAEELKATGSAEATHIDQVTVLFTDFKGFTAMSEKLSPRDLVKDLHECFSLFDQITEKYGIEKIKTIGDAYMAAGGLPTPSGTHAADALNAALEMRDVVEQGKARKIEAGLPYFEVRIGLHTGPVVAGIVGVKKFQYDIWGDTVNTASRMESSGAVGRVNISSATYTLIKHLPGFSFTHRGSVLAKGKGEMEMYFAERTVA